MKIRRIKFDNHPVLGDILLDFCDGNNKTVDTIIIAGENGVGKSTVLNELFKIASRESLSSVEYIDWMEIETDDEIAKLDFYDKIVLGDKHKVFKTQDISGELWSGNRVENRFPSSAIFSDVDINFNSISLNSVTSLSLDEISGSRKSETNLPNQINQLIIDVQALDDADIAKAVRENPELKFNELGIERRIDRFSNAFSKVFEDIEYDCVDNSHGNKVIYFKKYNKRIPINSLSSGEKQIVYRGCFLLKDVNAMHGASIFIDEPEISMHPEWQKKIMEYYKDIFTDEDGKQTSQIFAVTHSPFIIHNENRNNDKVIVLTRKDSGEIEVSDKPEYYYSDTLKAVEDAFFINDFSKDKSTVYLEGKTDEKYFNKAIEVYKLNVPFKFRRAGYTDDNGNEVFTGSNSLDHAYHFLVSMNLPIKNFCLKDCDTKSRMKNKNNVYLLSIEEYENGKGMKAGIENALVLDKIDTSSFYNNKKGAYGENNQVFDKNGFCDYICSMNNKDLKEVLIHIKEVIERIGELYNQ